MDEYPEKKDDMLKISDRLTVPQVFFGEQHLGGASDILNLEKDGKLLHMYKKYFLLPYYYGLLTQNNKRYSISIDSASSY